AVACEQADALMLKRSKAVLDLGKGVARIPHRHERERAEAAGPTCAQFACEFVAAAGELQCRSALAELNAGLGKRGQRGLNAEGVHCLERALGRPVRIAADRRAGARFVGGILVELRDEMKMNIDAAGREHDLYAMPKSFCAFR